MPRTLLRLPYEHFSVSIFRPDAATTTMLDVRSPLHENHDAALYLIDTMACLLRNSESSLPVVSLQLSEELTRMGSESAFRANRASLAESVKKSSLEDLPEEDQAELDLVEQLSLESNRASDGAASDPEEGESSADNEPLTIYLKEISSVQLLTHQQEIEIAKRREAGESQIVGSILSTPVALQYVLGLADKIQSDEIRLSEVIEGLTREDDGAGAPVEFQFDRRDAFLNP